MLQKLMLAIPLGACLLAAADRQVPKPLEIPAAAVESEPGAFHFTDAQGVRWVYYKTPFGVTRAAGDGASRKSTAVPEGITAVEVGNTIHFERPGPFGMFRWQRQKSELNEMERAVWNRQQSSAAAGSGPAQE